MSNHNNFVWTEKYRPKTIDECILSKDVKSVFNGFISVGKVGSLLLCGGPGMGKTTAAKALCNMLNLDWIMMNCSDETGVDNIRTNIKKFASTVSFDGKKKAVILDEADYLSPNAQALFRGVIEEFANHCSFIFTCNYKNKIIQPLHSRCHVVEIKIPSGETVELMREFYKRVVSILAEEKVEFDKKVVGELVKKNFPDFRRTLNVLQRYSNIGSIDSGVLSSNEDTNFSELIDALKQKKYNDIRKWVALNRDIDPAMMFSSLYDILHDKLVPTSIPEMVVLIADYSYKSAFVVNQEINTMAFLVQVMTGLQFKNE